MRTRTRRRFVSEMTLAGAALAGSRAVAGSLSPAPRGNARATERISLGGTWEFRLDTTGAGEAWLREEATSGWTPVSVPHTWQVTPASAEHYGVAWYRRRFAARPEWRGECVRVEFESVFHSAIVWLNGRRVGEHLRKGYTSFTLDLGAALRFDVPNLLVVRVENTFDEQMLPRGRSSDWAHDGGIYRPVTLLVSPPAFIDRVAVDGVPLAAAGTSPRTATDATADAEIRVAATVRNTTAATVRGTIDVEVIDSETGLPVLAASDAGRVSVGAGQAATVVLPPARYAGARLWHFDHPHLYALRTTFHPETGAAHRLDATFGIRTFEARDGALLLNGERVQLMGVERMAGSHPDHGMAEPSSWIEHDHADMKDLNCVLTRVHWMQDRRVLDYCDRHGMLMQLEVPTWGPDTFKGSTTEPVPALMQNGLEQLREMIEQNRNHPSVVIWGLCNEIGGQNPPAYEFARRMREEAKRLDPRRPAAYASHSLYRTPGKDVTELMDIVEWNEYFESWQGGSLEDVRRTIDEISRAFPGKPVIISEYGYCACTPERIEGDGRRIEILKTHTSAYRDAPHVAGLIFFCYNDYRTHVGDRGTGVLKQRVHGVVDLYGARKPSYDVLRDESSPIAALTLAADGNKLTATIRTRLRLPAYTLAGYRLRWVVYAAQGYPVEQHEVELPLLAPGTEKTIGLAIEPPFPARVQVDVVRATGFAARSACWTA
ncbi:MAG: glycoside hydrolase family 2 protein [Bacteroidales bacterium]